MGVYSKDGTPHHSMSRAKMHDEKMGSAKPPAKTHTPSPKSKSMKDLGKMDGEEDQGIEQIVKEHGPAHGMHYSIQEGSHHVVTHHAHGHVHHSEHASFGEAHEHMGKAGGEGAEQEPTESPDEAEEMPMGGGASGGGIPGLNG